MSDYTKSTNFASKDSLISGNPLKIVKGAELDTEFNNIATAVATKADNAAAAITGGTITGITDLAVADGGTGASTASGARSNLGAAASGANSDITSLSGLTTALTVAQGGTGATSLTSGAILKGAGTGAISAASASDIVSAIGSTAVTKATDATNAIGYSQSWQSVSRSAGTDYQNTTGKPIQVSVVVTGGDYQSASFYVGASTGSYVQIGYTYQIGAGTYQTVTFIVPNNHYYKVTLSGDSINSWVELR